MEDAQGSTSQTPEPLCPPRFAQGERQEKACRLLSPLLLAFKKRLKKRGGGNIKQDFSRDENVKCLVGLSINPAMMD